jgi:alkanesulfonate monooxygenase SsuD/methylene tetrahydromethanopterin reductase-like flavin-dependent oxidoreductase (luciferase family)
MARIGLALTGGLAPGDIVECVQLAEELGYESVWMEEGHGGDQFAILTAYALATARIRLGTAISSVFVRSLPTIAMAAATVDHLSQQRFMLGLGSSHKVQVEPEHGLPYGRPVSRIRDSVAVIRTLLRDGVVSYQGKTVSIERFDLWFTPTRPEIPIYLAALFPPMLEVCGELAQGVLLVWSMLGTARQAAEHIARGAHRAGRSPEAIDIAALLPCSVAARARSVRIRMEVPYLRMEAPKGHWSREEGMHHEVRRNFLTCYSCEPRGTSEAPADWPSDRQVATDDRGECDTSANAR